MTTTMSWQKSNIAYEIRSSKCGALNPPNINSQPGSKPHG